MGVADALEREVNELWNAVRQVWDACENVKGKVLQGPGGVWKVTLKVSGGGTRKIHLIPPQSATPSSTVFRSIDAIERHCQPWDGLSAAIAALYVQRGLRARALRKTHRWVGNATSEIIDLQMKLAAVKVDGERTSTLYSQADDAVLTRHTTTPEAALNLKATQWGLASSSTSADEPINKLRLITYMDIRQIDAGRAWMHHAATERFQSETAYLAELRASRPAASAAASKHDATVEFHETCRDMFASCMRIRFPLIFGTLPQLYSHRYVTMYDGTTLYAHPTRNARPYVSIVHRAALLAGFPKESWYTTVEKMIREPRRVPYDLYRRDSEELSYVGSVILSKYIVQNEGRYVPCISIDSFAACGGSKRNGAGMLMFEFVVKLLVADGEDVTSGFIVTQAMKRQPFWKSEKLPMQADRNLVNSLHAQLAILHSDYELYSDCYLWACGINVCERTGRSSPVPEQAKKKKVGSFLDSSRSFPSSPAPSLP